MRHIRYWIRYWKWLWNCDDFHRHMDLYTGPVLPDKESRRIVLDRAYRDWMARKPKLMKGEPHGPIRTNTR